MPASSIVRGGDALRAADRNLAVVANEHCGGGRHRLLDSFTVAIIGEDGAAISYCPLSVAAVAS